MARVKNPHVRAAVASFSGPDRSDSGDSWFGSWSPHEISDEALLLLLQDDDGDVRAAALSNCGAAAVRVAARDDVSVDVLVGYSRSAAAVVRHAVAANVATPAPALANLARDGDVSVRAAVAANRATPQAALGVLASDLSEDVLLGLLSNANTPTEFLEQQARRPSDWGEGERHRRLARNPGSPEGVLRKIAYSQWVDVRELVAGNPTTPPDTLEILSLDESPRVRGAVENRR